MHSSHWTVDLLQLEWSILLRKMATWSIYVLKQCSNQFIVLEKTYSIISRSFLKLPIQLRLRSSSRYTILTQFSIDMYWRSIVQQWSHLIFIRPSSGRFRIFQRLVTRKSQSGRDSVEIPRNSLALWSKHRGTKNEIKSEDRSTGCIEVQSRKPRSFTAAYAIDDVTADFLVGCTVAKLRRKLHGCRPRRDVFHRLDESRFVT